jgi:transferase family hexapeptide repeat protein/bacillosamine biosynthesis N-acetyltransferase PglD-like protein
VATVSGLVLVGASGLAREATAVAVLLQHDGPVQVVDDDHARWGTLHGLAPVLGAVDLVPGLVDHEVVLTLGKGRIRRRVATRLAMLGLDASRYTTLLHPRLVLPGSCHIGRGSIALDGVVLTADVEVGEHVVLGMNASVREGVRIGADATVGMGSVVLDDVPAGETWVGVPARPIRTGVHA